ncbi:hypothetical protein H0H92_003266 [Tricholoma furcatifolium]|nr:hypothetical protein H0H92_003266 [Tricholoma furcatifolium]
MRTAHLRAKKRARIGNKNAKDASTFLDLEASVSGSEPEEDEEEVAEEMADFVNDDEESDDEDSTCLTMSHRELNRMFDVEEQHKAWQELLALEDVQQLERRQRLLRQSTCDEEATALRKKYLQETRQASLDCNDILFYDPYETYKRHFYPDRIRAPSDPAFAPAGITGLLPPPEHDKYLWRVSVKRGREEALAFTLFNKALTTGIKVSSVIGRLSTPGWIYIEMKDFKDVQQLCTDVIDIHVNKIVSIPSKDAPSILREVPFTYPKLGEWVRITRDHLYKGDLAWVVAKVDNVTHDLLVVPRVELYPPKRKRKGIPSERPPQCRLEFGKLVDLGIQGVTKAHVAPQNDLPHFSEPRSRIPTNIIGDYDTESNLPLIVDFILRRHRYIEGYRVLRTQHFKPAIPTAQELDMFTECPLISTTIMANARLMLDALRLQSGDPVKVIDGDTRGAVGHVMDIDASRSQATVALLDGPMVDISLNILRKTLSIGDSVCVVEGNYAGFTGWIVSITANTVHVFDDRTGEAIEVAPHQIIFYEEKKTIYKTQGTIHKPIPRGQSPNERFVGREVKIIRGPFKDYEGRVKNTERGDVLNVEIQATMQQRQFRMDDLAHLHDPQLRPLIEFARHVGDLPEFKPTERMLPPMPPSSRPLVPSTPIPEGSSAEMGRAWNPSSRTPNPLSGFPCNSYMDSHRLNEELRVHVEILGTKPILKDPGWKLGDFEGRRGLWCKHDNEKPGFACVRFGLRHMEHLPEKYVSPIRPTAIGQRVIVINSTDARFCLEYYVLKIDRDMCRLRPFRNVTDHRLRFDLLTSHLAVVS